MSSFFTWCTVIMPKISSKTTKFLLNYNYLFWGLLFIGTQCIEWRRTGYHLTTSIISCVNLWRPSQNDTSHAFVAFICGASTTSLVWNCRVNFPTHVYWTSMTCLPWRQWIETGRNSVGFLIVNSKTWKRIHVGYWVIYQKRMHCWVQGLWKYLNGAKWCRRYSRCSCLGTVCVRSWPNSTAPGS